MKKLLVLIAIILLILASVVMMRTSTLESRQISVERVEPARVDAAQVAQELSKALQFETISFEDRAKLDGEEFLALHDYLEETFPRVHSELERQKINQYSLLYKWPGSDENLKPAALMAHTDVVPVEPGTENDWTHPAYSGAIAEGFVWGRGAMDDKGPVIAILHSAESLLEQGYRPRRTFYFAFGHDEELGGDEGARRIAESLAEANVTLDFVIDEGGAVVDGSNIGLAGSKLAAVSIAEKGSASIHLTVESEGGHSSIPPQKTAIGILAEAVSRLEDNQVPGGLRSPVSQMLEYLGPEMPFPSKMAFANLWLFEGLIMGFYEENPVANAMIRTTTAATIFNAGFKANVLPDTARAVVNFRILPGDTIESVVEHVRRVVADDRVKIEVPEEARDPSSVSSLESPSWTTLQRTIRELYPDAVVVPSLLVAGTDSRHFTGLTDGVYRFAGIQADTGELRRAHGTDERISLANLEQLTRFFIHLIRNSSEQGS
jgi:carboxypeptidase PM20D1